MSALRSVAISKLTYRGTLRPEHPTEGARSPDFPSECLVVCHNPTVAASRAANREVLLSSTEPRLDELAAQYTVGVISRDRFI